MSDALDTVKSEARSAARSAARNEPLLIEGRAPGVPDFTPMFWRAKYLRPSALLHQIPFLFWMVDTKRPRCVVTLGDPLGVAHFALCQAVERLGLPEVRCLLAAEWDGAADRFDAIARHAHTEYREISEIRRQPPVEAMASLSAGSVDLLVVDLDLDEATIDRLNGAWAERMAPGGVLLLHGARARLDSVAGRAYRAALDETDAVFEFVHGEGLLVACPRGDAGDKLSRLATLAHEPSGRARIRQIFARLGQSHVDEIGRAEAETALERSRSALRDAEARLCVVGDGVSGQATAPASGHTAAAAPVTAGAAAPDAEESGGFGAAMASALSRFVSRGSPGARHEAPGSVCVDGDASETDANLAAMIRERDAALAAQRAEATARVEERRAAEAERADLRARIAERDAALADANRTIEAQASRTDAVTTQVADLERERAQVARLNREIALLVERIEYTARERDAAKAELAALHAARDVLAERDSEAVLRAEAMAAEAEARRIDHAAALARQAAELAETRRRLAERLLRGRRADREIAELSRRMMRTDSDANVLRLLVRSIIGAGRSGLKRFVRNYRPHFGLPSVRRQIALVRAAPEFDAAWYLASYPEVAKSGYSPAEHYVRIGAFEGLNPGPDFDTLAYYARNRDVARRGLNALAHHLVTKRSARSAAAPTGLSGSAAVSVP